MIRRLRWPNPLNDQRGIALASALFVLMILLCLTLAFAALSRTEPIIAANQLLSGQARAMAESGLERALWALTSTTIPNPMATSPAAAPYDGGTFVALGTTGGFRVTVTTGATANERTVDAIGWAPGDPATYTGTKARKHLQAVATLPKWLDPPAALSVRAPLSIEGTPVIDARPDASCGNKVGTYTTGAQDGNGGSVYAADGNNTANQSTDKLQNQPTSAFDAYTFSNADLDALKALAKSSGTYYGPGSPSGWNGSISWSTANKIPANGLIFVDTVSGTNPTATTPDGDLASVRISGSAAPTGSTEFKGWLIVNGTIEWRGSTRARALVYAQNDISFSGNETIYGAVVSRSIKNTAVNNIDSEIGGVSTIQYDCAAAKTGGGTIPSAWMVKAGTYKEISD